MTLLFMRFKISTVSLKMLFSLALVGALAVGCAQNLTTQGHKLASEGNYEKAIETLKRSVQEKPDDYKAWRELGYAYFQSGNYPAAVEALNRSSAIRPDAYTQIYLGLVKDKQNLPEEALNAHRRALELDPPKEMVKQINNHMELAKRRNFVRSAWAREDSIDVDTIPTNTVAVYDFDGSSLPPELAPIAAGLSEFVAIDLGKVKSLTVVERLRLQVLVDEMGLVKEGVVDPTSAPRVGRILGSHKVITGWVSSPESKLIRMSGAIKNTFDKSESRPESEEGKLKKLFKMEKAFVYGILAELGIEPTEEEREEIARTPTDSYEAFLAYCRGLHYRKRGEYEKASESFEKASSIDEGFTEASVEAETTIAMSADADFESVVAEIPGAPGGLGERLGGIVGNTGAINSSGGNDASPDKPPVIPTGSVKVTGKLGDD